ILLPVSNFSPNQFPTASTPADTGAQTFVSNQSLTGPHTSPTASLPYDHIPATKLTVLIALSLIGVHTDSPNQPEKPDHLSLIQFLASPAFSLIVSQWLPIHSPPIAPPIPPTTPPMAPPTAVPT